MARMSEAAFETNTENFVSFVAWLPEKDGCVEHGLAGSGE